MQGQHHRCLLSGTLLCSCARTFALCACVADGRASLHLALSDVWKALTPKASPLQPGLGKCWFLKRVNDSSWVGYLSSRTPSMWTRMRGGVLQSPCGNVLLEGGMKVRPCVHLELLMTREVPSATSVGEILETGDIAVRRPQQALSLSTNSSLDVPALSLVRVMSLPGLCCHMGRYLGPQKGPVHPAGNLSASLVQAVVTELDKSWLLDLYAVAIAVFSGIVFDPTGSSSFAPCPRDYAAASPSPCCNSNRATFDLDYAQLWTCLTLCSHLGDTCNILREVYLVMACDGGTCDGLKPRKGVL